VSRGGSPSATVALRPTALHRSRGAIANGPEEMRKTSGRRGYDVGFGIMASGVDAGYDTQIEVQRLTTF
jgi:hypothetical protein